MRDPNNLKQADYKDHKITTIELDQIPDFTMEDYDLTDPKEFKRYMDSVERIVRGSFEYREMIKYFRENLDMNKCTFYQNVSNIDTFKIKIEIHHEPFSLYDICTIVYNKRCYYHENIDENMVAKEVMFLHYKLMVGLIPLAQTVHELVHNSYLFIPTDRVYGKFLDFVAMYEDFMTAEQLDILQRCIEFTKKYNQRVTDLRVLDTKYIYIDDSGAYNFPTLQDIIGLMNDRIKEIKADNGHFVEQPKQEEPKKLINPIIRTKKK